MAVGGRNLRLGRTHCLGKSVLRRAGYGDHPRVSAGQELLLDRTLEGGGVNYGNRNVLGRPLEPLPGPTAIMLLALQVRPEDPRVQKSLAYLCDAALTGDDLEHLVLGASSLMSIPGRPAAMARERSWPTASTPPFVRGPRIRTFGRPRCESQSRHSLSEWSNATHSGFRQTCQLRFRHLISVRPRRGPRLASASVP